MQIKWTKRAANNLDSVVGYIAQDNPIAARKFLGALLQKIDQLHSFPLLGRPGLVPLTRELVIHQNYIAYYRIKQVQGSGQGQGQAQEQIEILRVLHVRRQYP